MDNNFPCLVRKKIGNRRFTGKEKGMKEKKINLHLLFNGKKKFVALSFSFLKFRTHPLSRLLMLLNLLAHKFHAWNSIG